MHALNKCIHKCLLLAGNYVTHGEKIFKCHGGEVPGMCCRGQAQVCWRSCVQVFYFFSCFYQRLKLVLNKVKRLALTSVVFLK